MTEMLFQYWPWVAGIGAFASCIIVAWLFWLASRSPMQCECGWCYIYRDQEQCPDCGRLANWKLKYVKCDRCGWYRLSGEECSRCTHLAEWLVSLEQRET